jgi:hypothetical protein
MMTRRMIVRVTISKNPSQVTTPQSMKSEVEVELFRRVDVAPYAFLDKHKIACVTAIRTL